MNYKQIIEDLYVSMLSTDMFKAMEATVEGSPWHREANVLVHTRMVLDEYIKRTDASGCAWTDKDFLGALACLFHDVGKPGSEITKHSESRGEYRAYHGHELLSARMFEEWAAENAAKYHLYGSDIHFVLFMIEHHMPWNNESNDKLDQLAKTAKFYDATVYCRALLADQFGRTSDDWETNTTRSAAWVQKFMERVEAVDVPFLDFTKPTVYVLIGASGSGKSTFTRDYYGSDDAAVFSLDDLRHEWYDPKDYSRAWQLASEDKTFEKRANQRYFDMLKERKDIMVDNTNTSAKRRRMFVVEARKRGYNVMGVLFPVKSETIVARQRSRSDKRVPTDAVLRQYGSIQTALFGEFDQVHVSMANLK